MGKTTKLLFVVTVLNFGVWGLVNCAIHGDAINGKIENGKYYVAMKGKFTEVSRCVYLYSAVHTCTQFVLFPTTILLGLFEMIGRKKASTRDRTTLPPRA